MKVAGIDTIPKGRKHMPRKAADRHVSLGEYQVDSVKFLPKAIKKTRYLVVACKPGVAITFTPLTTTIYAQTHYATGIELKVMKEVVLKTEKYLMSRKRSLINKVHLV